MARSERRVPGHATMRPATFRAARRRCSLFLGVTLLFAMLPLTVCAQAVVALRIDAGRPHDDWIETRFARCIADAFPPPSALRRDAPAAALRDALFPWLDPGVAPTTAEEFANLLETRLVRERLNALGVRYFVVLTGGPAGKQSTDAFAMVPYWGFWGILQERQDYALRASIWDIHSRTIAGTGHGSWSQAIGMVGIFLPVPFYYSTEAQACDEMVRSVRKVIEVNR